MTEKIITSIKYCHRYIKYLFLLALAVLLFEACEKEPPPGSLHLTFVHEDLSKSGVECLLYEALYKFQFNKYLRKDFSNGLGEVLFENLETGWYYIEAHVAWFENLSLYAVDSIEIEAGKRTSKLIYLLSSPI